MGPLTTAAMSASRNMPTCDSASLRILEPRELELGQCRNRTRCQHDAVHQMIRQLGAQLLLRQIVRVQPSIHEFFGGFPDRVMASQKHDATPLERRDRVVMRRECT